MKAVILEVTAVLCTGACIGLLGVLLSRSLDQPEVHRTWPGGECVRVIEVGTAVDRKGYSCDNLPEQYDVVWVQY